MGASPIAAASSVGVIGSRIRIIDRIANHGVQTPPATSAFVMSWSIRWAAVQVPRKTFMRQSGTR